MPFQLMTGSVQGPGSEYLLVVNPDGSINTIVTGSIMIGSVSATVDSVYIQSGNNVNLGSAWTNIGSVLISNPEAIGSLSIQSMIGSVNQNTDPWRVTGSVNTYGTGSVRVSEWGVNTPITTTGSVSSYGTGSVRVSEWGTVGSFVGSVYQLTNPWVTSGVVSNRVAGSIVDWPGSIAISNFNAIGSSSVITNFGDLGSQRTISAGSIRLLSTTGSIGVYSDSALAISGVVNQGTNPWI